ncbi:MAG: hypothetical protein RJA22_2664 [Verrucomicrobiota bacterium]
MHASSALFERVWARFQPVLLAVLGLLPLPAAGMLEDEVARRSSLLVDASGTDASRAVGLVVVVVNAQATRVHGFGALRAGGTLPPDGATCFQIGSVSKAFTGLLLASLVEDPAGGVRPEDPVNRHLGPDLRAPAFGTQPVTLLQLATHRGSMPDFPDNMTGPPTSPALDYSRAQLSNFLSGLVLPVPPGSTYRYSNVGLGLLGVALADASGWGSYSALLRERLTAPLGMLDTGLNEPAFLDRLRPRLAQGYRVAGGGLAEVAVSDMGVLEGAGELLSTGDDLGRYLRVCTGLAAFPVAGAMDRALTPAAAGAPGQLVGYGIDVVALPDGRSQFEKGGVVAGYTTYVAFRRQPAAGVAVMSNRGQHQAIATLARDLVALLDPPVLTLGRAGDGSLSAAFTAAAGQNYALQASSNLIDWRTVAGLTNSAATNAPLSFPVRRTNAMEFLRVQY